MSSDKKKPADKRKYIKPQIVSEDIFETSVLIGPCPDAIGCKPGVLS